MARTSGRRLHRAGAAEGPRRCADRVVEATGFDVPLRPAPAAAGDLSSTVSQRQDEGDPHRQRRRRESGVPGPAHSTGPPNRRKPLPAPSSSTARSAQVLRSSGARRRNARWWCFGNDITVTAAGMPTSKALKAPAAACPDRRRRLRPAEVLQRLSHDYWRGSGSVSARFRTTPSPWRGPPRRPCRQTEAREKISMNDQDSC